MILWTIQHKEAYIDMLRTGSLRANNNYLFCQDDFPEAYNWMAQQIRERISEPPDGVQYPVWLWHTWEDERKRPDMRKNWYGDKGTPIVLLTVDVPDNAVLLSDFDTWHFVLSNAYLPKNTEDDRPHSIEETRKSWNQIFDIFSPDKDKYCGPTSSIQATTWEIRREWVKKAEFFISK